MSLQDIQVRTETELNNIYTALDEQGATIPEQKNLINVAPAIRSIVGGGEPPTQVHNYLMLYDGTLGEAGENGANVCSEVTGGYKVARDSTDFWTAPSIIYNSDNLFVNSDNSVGGVAGLHYYGSFISNNVINLGNYVQAGVLALAYITNNTNCKIRTSMYSEQSVLGTRLVDIISHDISSFVNNSKKLYTGDISTLTSAYFGGVASEEGVNTAQLKIYDAFLVSRDDWQTLLDLAGITATYTDEASICAEEVAMTTILNNEEAVEYMIYNCTGTFMLAFIQSTIALSILGASEFQSLIYSNEVWSKFLSMIA